MAKGFSCCGVTASDLRVFFTTIAVLLGTGILGLPIKLVYTGFTPYLVLFSITFVLQIAVVFVHTDTLQYAQRHMLARLRVERGTQVTAGPQPDLHTVAQLYLTPVAAIVFDAAVLLTFIATLISYSLAGANAFAQLFNVPVPDLIIPFVGACTFVLIFASGLVAPVIAVLTLVKVLLLTFIIGTCGVVAEYVKRDFHESWADVMNPFLVGTVAIGGISMMMSVFFAYSRPTATDIAHFRAAIIAGIAACFLLNVVWARAVLGIVPQTEADAIRDGANVSLEAAGDAGDIATKPVISIIRDKYVQYLWVADTVTAFITLSITVSFNAVGLGIKHVLDGMAVTVMRGSAARLHLPPREVAALAESMAGAGDGHGGGGGSRDAESSSLASFLASFLASLSPAAGLAALRRTLSSAAGRVLLTTRGLMYAATFGTVLGVALLDPSGFITVLEVFVSMALNLGGGVLVVLMYVGVRTPPRGSRHRAALLAGGHGVLAAREAAAAAAAHSASRDNTDESSSPLTGSSGEGGAPQEGGEDSSSSAVHRRYELAGAGASTSDGDGENDPIARPLNETLGAVLSVFCMATFSVAVVYDIYSAGVNKGVYGPDAGAWVALSASVLFWRHAFLPMIRWLRRSARERREEGRVGNAPGLPRPKPRLAFVYSVADREGGQSDGEDEEERREEEDWDNGGGAVGWFGGGGAVDGASHREGGAARGGRPSPQRPAPRSWASKALRAITGFNFADEVMDVGVALTTAWSTAVGCSTAASSSAPLLTSALAAAIIALHIVFTPLLRTCCRASAPALRLAMCVLTCLLLGGLAGLNLWCGAAGPAGAQLALLLYVAGATLFRLRWRTPADPLGAPAGR